MERLYARNPRITGREVENDLFLVDPDSDETYYLNVTGVALWRLFADPTSVETVLEVAKGALGGVLCWARF